MVYVADAQVLIPRRSIVVTTADGHPERLIPQIRAELAALDSRVPIEFAQLSELISRSLLWSRLGVLLVTTFALAGLVLAASGVFGVIAFVSAQRSPEMAVRLALGATPGQIIALVLRHAGRLALVGVGLGLMLAGWTGYLMRTYLYGANAGSWLVIGGSSIIVFAVCMAATVPAARRAAVTHPAQLLRS
jgi:ABC-type antimicrobial peptide transport system permease subunit